jgi:hypothetical protein
MEFRPSTSPQPHLLPTRLLLGVVLLLGYMAVANTVQQFYPFSVFDMYAHATTSASRIGARASSGELSEVFTWTDWRCDGPLSIETPPDHAQKMAYSIPYRDREAQEWLTTHQGDGGERVDVVRHIWWLTPDPGQPAQEDRLILHCQAVRR